MRTPSALLALSLAFVGCGFLPANAAAAAASPSRVPRLAPDKPRAFITAIAPSSGDESGGTRVTLTGSNFPFFARGVRVTVNGGQLCRDVRVLMPFRSLSCTMPVCTKCGDAEIKVVLPEGGGSVNAARFHFVQACFEGDLPPLPRRNTPEEECVVCKAVVASVVSLAGDTVSNQGLRDALRGVCDTAVFKAFGAVDDSYCRIDLSLACIILYHSHGLQIADEVWRQWDAHYLYGGLPGAVCSELRRCAGQPDTSLPEGGTYLSAGRKA